MTARENGRSTTKSPAALQAENATLKAEITALQAENAILRARIVDLRKPRRDNLEKLDQNLPLIFRSEEWTPNDSNLVQTSLFPIQQSETREHISDGTTELAVQQSEVQEHISDGTIELAIHQYTIFTVSYLVSKRFNDTRKVILCLLCLCKDGENATKKDSFSQREIKKVFKNAATETINRLLNLSRWLLKIVLSIEGSESWKGLSTLFLLELFNIASISVLARLQTEWRLWVEEGVRMLLLGQPNAKLERITSIVDVISQVRDKKVKWLLEKCAPSHDMVIRDLYVANVNHVERKRRRLGGEGQSSCFRSTTNDESQNLADNLTVIQLRPQIATTHRSTSQARGEPLTRGRTSLQILNTDVTYAPDERAEDLEAQPSQVRPQVAEFHSYSDISCQYSLRDAMHSRGDFHMSTGRPAPGAVVLRYAPTNQQLSQDSSFTGDTSIPFYPAETSLIPFFPAENSFTGDTNTSAERMFTGDTTIPFYPAENSFTGDTDTRAKRMFTGDTTIPFYPAENSFTGDTTIPFYPAEHMFTNDRTTFGSAATLQLVHPNRIV